MVHHFLQVLFKYLFSKIPEIHHDPIQLNQIMSFN